MGGSGSGYRWDKKPRVEDTLILDIALLKRAGYFQDTGVMRYISWSRGERVAASIGLTVHDGFVNLNYESNGQPVATTIDIEEFPCHYGGTRLYFLCPRCNRRAVNLYGLNRLFLCRECNGLTYESRRDRFGGSGARIYRLEKRLEKKGLHARTRQRICDQIDRQERRVYGQLGLIDLRLQAMERAIEARAKGKKT